MCKSFPLKKLLQIEVNLGINVVIAAVVIQILLAGSSNLPAKSFAYLNYVHKIKTNNKAQTVFQNHRVHLRI